MKKEWEIKPLIGVGPLKFGMSMADVENIELMGKPSKTLDMYDGSKSEYRSMNIPVCNYIDGKLSTIDTNWRINDLFFKNISIYTEDPRSVSEKLQKLNGYTLMGLGSLLFPEIGLNVSGFFDEEAKRFRSMHSSEQDDRGVAIFQKGAFDELLENYQRVDIGAF
jgi:hypothetical protein